MHTELINPCTILQVKEGYAATKTTMPGSKPRKQKCRHLYLIASQLLILTLLCGSLWGILRDQALPGSEIFALGLLAVSSHIGGKITSCVKLPPLLGMLIVGFLFRNLPFIPYHKDISTTWTAILRNIALVIILLRAGLGLCPDTLRRLSCVVFKLSFIPCIVEAATCAIATHFLLGLPWVWSFLLGFVICAISPAIIVPSMLALKEKGLGNDKGIPTLIIAASTVDDVFSITGFGVFLGIAFSSGNLAWTIVKGPLEVLVGLAYGTILGVITWYIPDAENPKVTFHRITIVILGGLAVMFVGILLDFAGSGALGCLGLAFVAAMHWRQDVERFSVINNAMSEMWSLIQPFLFAIIGAEVPIYEVKDDIGYAILSLVLASIVRIMVTSIVTCGSGLSVKESLFVAAAWLPKATVQAAIGSTALDLARLSNSGPEFEDYGKKVLTVAVLSILLTAPLGAVLISFLGPRLLTLDEEPAKREDDVSIIEIAASSKL